MPSQIDSACHMLRQNNGSGLSYFSPRLTGPYQRVLLSCHKHGCACACSAQIGKWPRDTQPAIEGFKPRRQQTPYNTSNLNNNLIIRQHTTDRLQPRQTSVSCFCHTHTSPAASPHCLPHCLTTPCYDKRTRDQAPHMLRQLCLHPFW
jgi:hypothetical protein